MNSTNRITAKRISVWVLIFALLFLMLSASFTVSAHAKGLLTDGVGRAARDVTNDVGNAIGDAGEVISDAGEAVSEALDSNKTENGGAVNDTDGVIGNEKVEAGAEANDDGRSIGWIGLVIAIVIVLIAIVLIIILIPKKKKR